MANYPGYLPRILSVSFAVILLINPLVLRAEREIVFAGDIWPPYVEGTFGQDDAAGIAIDLLKEIFDRIDDVSFSYSVMAWKRALRAVQSGDKDGIPFLRKTGEREAYMAFTEPVFSSYNLIWYSADKFPRGFMWQGLQGLAPYRLGIIRGYSYGEMIDEAVIAGQLKATDVTSINQLFSMLERKRVDLVVANDAAEIILRRRGITGIKASANPVDRDIYHIGFSKKSAVLHLIPVINKIIKRMAEDGTIKRIVQERNITVIDR